MNASTADTGARTLVVLVHAYTHNAARLDAVARRVLEAWPDATLLRPELDTGRFSLAHPDDLVVQLLGEIDARWKAARDAGEPFARIVLVGHSIGALLLRKAYVVACGEHVEAPFEAAYRPLRTAGHDRVPAREWAGAVARLVLLAGMNRGWRVSHHLNLLNAPLWAVGSAACQVIRALTRRWPLIFAFRKGAAFITQLRIQWLVMRRHAAEGAGGASTVQLLGSRDDMVAPYDNVDLVSGGDFHYLDVPQSGHADVIEMDDPAHGAGRAEVFKLALVAPESGLRAASVVPADENFAAPNPAIRNVAFVMHGIRDAGYWTHKIARRIRMRSGDHEAWATETSSYGYFPMLPFLLPWYRREKVEWLMDQYAEAMARYPNATFHYVGHSNGTYLLARALELYPCCRFERVVFAGSVVRSRYDWTRFTAGDSPRIRSVLNYVATGDWVVAWFPKLFQLLPVQDLGSAGHDGFAALPATMAPEPEVQGGHSAAIAEAHWDDIADFVVSGKRRHTAATPRVRNVFVQVLGWFPPVVWLAIVALLAAVWLGIFSLIAGLMPIGIAQGFVVGLAFGAYLLLIWGVATRI
jgi:hypothetical protein